MFHKATRFGARNEKHYEVGRRLVVKTASELLSAQSYQVLMDKVDSLADMPAEYCHASYHIFVRRFAEFVQALPKTINSGLCGVLNAGLLRAVKVLQYTVDEFDDITPLERFAVFSAALLRDVASVYTQYQVAIVDENGKVQSFWDPMQGPLTQVPDAKFYKLFPFRINYTRIKDPITAMLATELIPPTTYEWLTDDRSVFVDWLDALFATGLKGGRLSHILDVLYDDESLLPLLDIELPDHDVELLDAPETEITERFLVWLHEQLEEGELKTAGFDAELHVIEGGAFIEARVLDKFARLYDFPNTVVFHQLGTLMGVAKKGGADFRFDQFFKGGDNASSLMAQAKVTVKGLYVSDKFVSAVASKVQLQLADAKQAVNSSMPSLGESKRQGLRPDALNTQR